MSSNAVRATEDAFFSATLAEADPEIADVIAKELGRQRDEIELIASENIVSRAPRSCSAAASPTCSRTRAHR